MCHKAEIIYNLLIEMALPLVNSTIAKFSIYTGILTDTVASFFQIQINLLLQSVNSKWLKLFELVSYNAALWQILSGRIKLLTMAL